MYLNSIKNFRALAIILIVAVHSFSFASIPFKTFPSQFLGNLISGGTTLFVFISGLLFFHVFYKRYTFRSFMAGKVRNVVIPYTILSIIPIWMVMNQAKIPWPFFEPTGPGFIEETLVPALKYYVTGRFATAYWYIPFIVVTFLMSPLHIAYIRLNIRWQIVIMAVLFAVSAVVQRPQENINTLQSVVAFTPVYLLGITCGMNLQWLYDKLTGREWIFAAIGLALAALEYTTGAFSNYHKDFFALKGIDLMLFQKVSWCIFFLIFLHRFENWSPRWVNTIAATSFAIFFLHPFFLKTLHTIRNFYGVRFDGSWTVYWAAVALVTGLSIATALAVRAIIGKNSRYLIGY
ncbi:MAG: acyltransferase [Hyphomicrobiales bacterium]|nr:MAG: acyltransferase [Hyphomicrobiales bacterium]